LQLTTPLGNWIDTVHNQRKWSYQYYEDNIIQTTNPYRYYTKIPNRHHQQTFQLQRQTAVVLNNNSTPAIAFHITNNTLSCHESTHSNQILHQPLHSTLCQPANIQYYYNEQLENVVIETIQIISKGTHYDTYISIGGILLVNGMKSITCNGKICKSNNDSELVIKTYTTYYLIIYLLTNTRMNYLSNNITILIDDRIVLSRLQKLNHKNIYPNACLLPEYEVIRAICTILKQIPNLTLRYQTSSIIHNDMTDIDPNDECTTLLGNTAQLNLQNTPIPALSTQHTELIINNQHITTNYQQSIREAFTQPEL
jgi:hypothetical protein